MANDGCTTPFQLIDLHLQELGWTQRTLALILGVNEQAVSRIMSGVKAVDAELALTLNAALGVDPERLMELQKNYELAKAKIEVRIDPGISRRKAMFGGIPISDMVKRGWLSGIKDVRDPDLEVALCRFFGVSSVDEITTPEHRAKKSESLAQASPAQLAWLYRVKQLADEMLVAKYSDASLKRAIQAMSSLRVSADAARKVPRVLTDAGVRFVIVEALPSTKIDGVCLWLDDKSPVVGLSTRFDRIDNFWFVLRHELEHVAQHHGRETAILDTEMEKDRSGAMIADEERIADLAAAEFCVPQESLNSFIARKSPFFAERDILGFAKTLGVHPGLVAGQLQRKTGRYDLFRDHLVKIRAIVAQGSLVDGWGDVAPIGA
ncbi:MAG: HigA family addiction module antidote protein [Bdellovibrionales bacterium]|nr:HigA family addiction module antidote protein [Bdellovibrionales bacterium]